MVANVLEINCFCDARHLVDVPHVAPDVRVVSHSLLATLETETKQEVTVRIDFGLDSTNTHGLWMYIDKQGFCNYRAQKFQTF